MDETHNIVTCSTDLTDLFQRGISLNLDPAMYSQWGLDPSRILVHTVSVRPSVVPIPLAGVPIGGKYFICNVFTDKSIPVIGGGGRRVILHRDDTVAPPLYLFRRDWKKRRKCRAERKWSGPKKAYYLLVTYYLKGLNQKTYIMYKKNVPRAW